MKKNDPVKLSPAYKDYLWGGEKLKSCYGKQTDISPLAESWELSTHKDGQSIIASGEYVGLSLSEYIEKIGKDALGKRAERFDYFPLLIKFIDAKSSLSVQVHPSDEYAMRVEGEYGKSEMWYIVDCDEGAFIYYGFARDVSRDEYESAIKDGTLTSILNAVPVKRGDAFYIEAGTVHAIGAGILICEIQQNSNTTYRVFDFNRRDKNGNLRELHIDKALEVSNLKKSPEIKKIPDENEVTLASCEYFDVIRLRVNGDKEISVDDDSFLSIISIDGGAKLIFDGGELDVSAGESVFVPANAGKITIIGECQLILSRIGDK